ncbi:hypothetical protein GGX14DRAFT_576651 [Mycena pura]|uniref:Uncharacterized protein n=1 Tax=Mycena pura TaxID=153505 RepID=A0AAD6UTI0_9AGAR|nr:hypothetical protein GGX14DRAFT_586925 [Mycena pura]KAJ7194160.1 hypothetical protein GGX14DRAFT_576651 [Mycena pura]
MTVHGIAKSGFNTANELGLRGRFLRLTLPVRDTLRLMQRGEEFTDVLCPFTSLKLTSSALRTASTPAPSIHRPFAPPPLRFKPHLRQLGCHVARKDVRIRPDEALCSQGEGRTPSHRGSVARGATPSPRPRAPGDEDDAAKGAEASDAERARTAHAQVMLVQILRGKVVCRCTGDRGQSDYSKVHRREVGDTFVNACYVLRGDLLE